MNIHEYLLDKALGVELNPYFELLTLKGRVTGEDVPTSPEAVQCWTDSDDGITENFIKAVTKVATEGDKHADDIYNGVLKSWNDRYTWLTENDHATDKIIDAKLEALYEALEYTDHYDVDVITHWTMGRFFESDKRAIYMYFTVPLDQSAKMYANTAHETAKAVEDIVGNSSFVTDAVKIVSTDLAGSTTVGYVIFSDPLEYVDCIKAFKSLTDSPEIKTKNLRSLTKNLYYDDVVGESVVATALLDAGILSKDLVGEYTDIDRDDYLGRNPLYGLRGESMVEVVKEQLTAPKKTKTTVDEFAGKFLKRYGYVVDIDRLPAKGNYPSLSAIVKNLHAFYGTGREIKTALDEIYKFALDHGNVIKITRTVTGIKLINKPADSE